MDSSMFGNIDNVKNISVLSNENDRNIASRIGNSILNINYEFYINPLQAKKYFLIYATNCINNVNYNEIVEYTKHFGRIIEINIDFELLVSYPKEKIISSYYFLIIKENKKYTKVLTKNKKKKKLNCDISVCIIKLFFYFFYFLDYIKYK